MCSMLCTAGERNHSLGSQGNFCKKDQVYLLVSHVIMSAYIIELSCKAKQHGVLGQQQAAYM